MRSRRWQYGLLLIAGAWMLCAPYLIPSHDEVERVAIWASHAVGAMLLILGSIALARPRRWLDWTSLAIGCWLIVAPLVLGFSGLAEAATSNHMLVGILVGLDALGLIALHRDELRPDHPRRRADHP